jgi:hypothetical protein
MKDIDTNEPVESQIIALFKKQTHIHQMIDKIILNHQHVQNSIDQVLTGSLHDGFR